MVETRGRRTGRPRRTVVGAHRDDDRLWIVAEQGRHAAWVRNLEAHPEVRVRQGVRWRAGVGEIVDGDDPKERLQTWGRPGHARLVERLGTDLTTVCLELRVSPS
jgi:deazaflavin-dependent oxidoreductase (nitroreductase family)